MDSRVSRPKFTKTAATGLNQRFEYSPIGIDFTQEASEWIHSSPSFENTLSDSLELSSDSDNSDGGVKLDPSPHPHPDSSPKRYGEGYHGDSPSQNGISIDTPEQQGQETQYSAPLRHRPCCNCAKYHEPVSGRWFLDCLVLSIHAKGQKAGQLNFRTLRTVLLPRSKSRRAAIGTQIWTAFERMKAENDVEREAVEQGRKRDVAPIPWLKWTGKERRSGKTRNEGNFHCLWAEKVVGEDVGRGDGTMAYISVPFDWDRKDV